MLLLIPLAASRSRPMDRIESWDPMYVAAAPAVMVVAVLTLAPVMVSVLELAMSVRMLSVRMLSVRISV